MSDEIGDFQILTGGAGGASNLTMGYEGAGAYYNTAPDSYYTHTLVPKSYVDSTFSFNSHDHLLVEGATDVTATVAEVNLLDLSGLTAGDVLSADTATTASWKPQTGGGGDVGGEVA